MSDLNLTCRVCQSIKLLHEFTKTCHKSAHISNLCKACHKARKKPSELDRIRKNLPGSKYSDW